MRTVCIQCDAEAIVSELGEGKTIEGETVMLGLCENCQAAMKAVQAFFQDDYVPDWEPQPYKEA